jgi:uncharacterized small protein (DUF1192 family)
MGMRRLLVVGKKIQRLPCLSWDELQAHNLLDYQGLLLDCRSAESQQQMQSVAGLLLPFMENRHTVYVILPEASTIQNRVLNLSILPHLLLTIEQQAGKTLNLVSHNSPFEMYFKCLNGHQLVFGTRVMPRPGGGSQPWFWMDTVKDNVNRSVCGTYGTAYIFHPPARGLDTVAVKAILEDFKPDFDKPEPEQHPDWANKVATQIPGVAEIESRIAKVTAEISALESQLVADRESRQELERWAEVLWLDGLPLQERVSDALAYLGVPNKSEDPTAHSQDLLGSCMGSPILFEVTGSTGSIGIEKGRQLHQWIAQREDATVVKGVLVGNAYRKHPPEERPPSPHHKLFVKEVEDLAAKFHFALVDVRDLFGLVVRKLDGEDIRGEDVCKALQADGLIKFNI